MPVDLLAHIFREKVSVVAPAAALREIVCGYYWYTCSEGNTPLWATLDGEPALLFLLDAPYTISFTGGNAITLEQAFFCCYGLQNTYISAWPQGMRLLVVKFSCNGLYQLLQQPLLSITRSPLVAMADVWGADGLALAAAIRNTGNPRGQAAVLDTFLRRQLPIQPQAAYLVRAAAVQIRQSKGQLSVQTLCREFGVNYKWLERNFKNQLGITPKVYINTIRFLHAYFSMEDYPGNLTCLALEHGYYDQPHFIKEFKRHTGGVPSGR
ncbi:helix-turn-helix transcriptional regulator [Chitinophaga agrisoli]|uniref:Helix-turn-helix transcriptional regulator n=1 Tax=Chitinophaga agrisoli TaxID=2607653 RepID=A0A5B2W3D9_9BACT|nr:AraC family transcriptional regulator [Chitinophaga agrisoli]KAA2245172.1 helix-turn-helix transcriptional regulator [Chitinophaga agrisoli]